MTRMMIAVGASALALTLGGAPAALAGAPLVDLGQSWQATGGNDSGRYVDASAGNTQVNVNVPINVLTNDSGNGDVQQRNDGRARAEAGSHDEKQPSGRQERSGGHGYPESCCIGWQPSANERTEQSGRAVARNEQANVSVPVDVLTNRSGNGDVHQRNDARSKAGARNAERAFRSGRQSSRAGSESCGCERDRGHGHESRRRAGTRSWPAAASGFDPIVGWPLIAAGGLCLLGGLAVRRLTI